MYKDMKQWEEIRYRVLREGVSKRETLRLHCAARSCPSAGRARNRAARSEGRCQPGPGGLRRAG